MFPKIPKNPIIGRPPAIPMVVKGAIYENVGKYARGAVLYAFEQIGGADALSEWAAENPSDFYTKLFPKIITREVEVTENRGVDELLTIIDGDYEIVVDDSPTKSECSDAFEAPVEPSPRGSHE